MVHQDAPYLLRVGAGAGPRPSDTHRRSPHHVHMVAESLVGWKTVERRGVLRVLPVSVYEPI